MKILLDENIDVRFKTLFASTSHSVFTVRDMQWNDIKNGELLKLLKKHQFDCWVVVDKNIPYQQNINKLPCKIVVVDIVRNTLTNIAPLISDIMRAIESNVSDKIIIISGEKKYI